MAIEPKTSDARDRLNDVLERLEREDPTFRRRIDPDTGQTIISGMGELHLEVLKHRMLTDFNVDANVGKPRVTYKETIRRAIDAQAEHHAPADPTTRAIVALHLDPVPAASSRADAETVVAERAAQDAPPRRQDVQVDFAQDVESALPRDVQEVIVEAVESAAAGGALAGYPLVRVHATVTRAAIAGTENPDPAAHAPLLEAAAARAVRQGAEEAGIFLLEPWMRFEIITPETFLGDILTDLAGRRGEVERTDPLDESGRGATTGHLVAGKVPLSTIFGYATALRSLSQGRATFTMEPLEYLPVPDELAEKFLL
jgi:elongation factor G